MTEALSGAITARIFKYQRLRALVAEPNLLENRPFYGRDNRSTGQQKRNVKLRGISSEI
jgi:hypothetical protein